MQTVKRKFNPDNEDLIQLNVISILEEIRKEFSNNARGKYGSEFHNNYDHDDYGILDMGGDQRYNAKYIKDMYGIDNDSNVPDELKYLDHMHLSEPDRGGSIQSILRNDSDENTIKSIIKDRNQLRKIIVAALQYKTVYNFKCNESNKCQGTLESPIIIEVPKKVTSDIYDLYKNEFVQDYTHRFILTSWIYKNFKKTHLLRHQIILRDKDKQNKNEITFKVIFRAPAKRTYDGLSNTFNVGKIMAKDYGDYKTFKEDEKRLKDRTIYIKFVGKGTTVMNIMKQQANSEQTEYEIQKGMVTGGKTHKRRPKATKKKNRPVKQKFTRKHRGGLAFSSKVEQIRLMDELMNSDDYMNDAAEGIREALKDSKTGPLVYGLKNQASSSPFNFHEFMADIFIPGTRDYKEKLNKIKNAYIVDKDNRIYLVKTSNVVRKLRLGNNRLKITFTPKLVPKLWLKSAMTDDRINKDQLRDELQRKAGTLLTDKSDSDAKIRGMITRKDNTYTFNEDKYQKNYGKKLLNIIKNLKLPNPESYITEFENHNHDDLDSESITYDKSIDVEILFKKVTENMGTTYTDLSSLPDYKKYLEAKTKQEKKSKPLAKEPKIEEVPENLPPPPPTNDGAKKMAESSTGTDTPVMVDSSTGDNATVMTESSTGTDIKEMKDSDSQTDMPATAKVVNTGVLKKKSGDVVA